MRGGPWLNSVRRHAGGWPTQASGRGWAARLQVDGTQYNGVRQLWKLSGPLVLVIYNAVFALLLLSVLKLTFSIDAVQQEVRGRRA